MQIRVIEIPLERRELIKIAEEGFGDMVKLFLLLCPLQQEVEEMILIAYIFCRSLPWIRGCKASRKEGLYEDAKGFKV